MSRPSGSGRGGAACVARGWSLVDGSCERRAWGAASGVAGDWVCAASVAAAGVASVVAAGVASVVAAGVASVVAAGVASVVAAGTPPACRTERGTSLVPPSSVRTNAPPSSMEITVPLRVPPPVVLAQVTSDPAAIGAGAAATASVVSALAWVTRVSTETGIEP